MINENNAYIVGIPMDGFFGPFSRKSISDAGVPSDIIERLNAQNHLCAMQNEMLNRLDEENKRLSSRNKALNKEIMRLQAMVESVSAHASMLEEICEENGIDVSDYMGTDDENKNASDEPLKSPVSENPMSPSENWWEYIQRVSSQY